MSAGNGKGSDKRTGESRKGDDAIRGALFIQFAAFMAFPAFPAF